VARGRAAIAAAWQQSIDSGIQDVKLHTADVVSSGELACETGIVQQVARDGKQSEARYVVVWKRVANEWKLFRDIWNSE
jgi:ketosteroid isomerase-like protein